MPSKLIWRGDEAMVYVKRRTGKVMKLACEDMVVRARELISVPVEYDDKGEVIVRSLPGEPPRAETWELQQSVTYEVDEERAEAWVGTPLIYGQYLELGTRRGIEPRPWLYPATASIWQKLGEYVRGLVN